MPKSPTAKADKADKKRDSTTVYVGERTADNAATLQPHGDGSATEHANVSANGTYPARPEAK